MNNPISMLNRTVVGLQSGRMPRDCRQWLLEGLDRYRKGQGSLEQCLGLSVLPGKRAVSTDLRLNYRDTCLQEAATFVDGGLTRKSQQVSQWIFLYREQPKTVFVSWALIHSAHETKLYVPTSPRQISRIIGGNRSM